MKINESNHETTSLNFVNFLISIFLACHFLLRKNLHLEVHGDGSEFVTATY